MANFLQMLLVIGSNSECGFTKEILSQRCRSALFTAFGTIATSGRINTELQLCGCAANERMEC